VAPGISRQLLGYGEALLMARVWFDKGAVGAVHQHHHAQLSYVESGEFEVDVGGQKQNLKTGDSFYIEPDKDHGVTCLAAGSILDLFSPLREDFLVGDLNDED